MKQLLNKAFVMLAVCALAVASTSCNSYDGDEAQQTTKTTITAKNSLRGVILDQNGAALTGATVKVNGSAVAVTGNSFEKTGLNDGTFTVVVKAAGYKDGEKVITLAKSTETINGESVVVGQDATFAIYLYKKETPVVVQVGSATGTSATNETITLETSSQNDGTGSIVASTTNTTGVESTITVNVTTPALTLTPAEVTAVTAQIPSGDINDLNYTIENLNSLDEATKATRIAIIAGDALPNNHTFFTGVKLQTTQDIDFSTILPNFTIDITIDAQDDATRDALKLFRSFDGITWTEVTATGDGIKVLDKQDGKYIIKLNRLKKQSFALGVQIDESTSTSVLPIVATPVQNNSASAVSYPNMSYTAKKRGTVITNNGSIALVDYLRKIILRYKSINAVKSVEDETGTYTFSPAYKLAAGGQLFLAGYQDVETAVYSAGNVSIQIQNYGDVHVYPYAVVPEVTHSGGSND